MTRPLHPSLSSIPIVVLTASAKALDLDGEVFALLHKPPDLWLLCETLARAARAA